MHLGRLSPVKGFSLGLCALWLTAFCLAGQGKMPTIPKSLPPEMRQELSIDNSSTWKPLSRNPLSLTLRADKWMSQLSSAAAVTHYLYEGPFGFGKTEGDVSVESPKKFRFDSAWVDEKGRQTKMGRRTTIADGSRLQWFDVRGYGPVVPVGRSRLTSKLLDAWPLEMQTLVFASLGTSDKPITAFVSSALSAKMKVTVEQRIITMDKRKFVSQRLLIDSPKSARRSYRAEIVFDGVYGAPVTLRVTRKNSLGVHRTFWAIQWNVQKNQSFAKALFELPRP